MINQKSIGVRLNIYFPGGICRILLIDAELSVGWGCVANANDAAQNRAQQ